MKGSQPKRPPPRPPAIATTLPATTRRPPATAPEPAPFRTQRHQRTTLPTPYPTPAIISLVDLPVRTTFQSHLHNNPHQPRVHIPLASLPHLVASPFSSPSSLGSPHLPMPSHFGLAWRPSRSVCSIRGLTEPWGGIGTGSGSGMQRGRGPGNNAHTPVRLERPRSSAFGQQTHRSHSKWTALASRSPIGSGHHIGLPPY